MAEYMTLVLHEQPDGSYKSDPVKTAGVYRWAILTRGFGEEAVSPGRVGRESGMSKAANTVFRELIDDEGRRWMVAKPKPECPKCEGSGEVAIEVGGGGYRGPGPVPDYAVGVIAARCRWCGGTGEANE